MRKAAAKACSYCVPCFILFWELPGDMASGFIKERDPREESTTGFPSLQNNRRYRLSSPSGSLLANMQVLLLFSFLTSNVRATEGENQSWGSPSRSCVSWGQWGGTAVPSTWLLPVSSDYLNLFQQELLCSVTFFLGLRNLQLSVSLHKAILHVSFCLQLLQLVLEVGNIFIPIL